MDNDRFDNLSRALVKLESRRRAFAAIATLAGLGALAPLELAAKKKKKKKKKKPPPCTTCTAEGDSCGSASFCKCCGSLICGPTEVCCKQNGAVCNFSAECCGTLTCIPFGDGTCQPCRTPGQSCNSIEECCSTACTNGFC